MNEFMSMKELSLLSERIWYAKQTDATKELLTSLWKIRKEKNMKPLNIMLVSTIDSSSAAYVIFQLIHKEMSLSDVIVETPQTALRIIRQSDWYIGCSKYDLVIAISYAGSEPDIIRVFEECMLGMHSIPFILLTGENKSELKEIYGENKLLEIISYFSNKDGTGKEKGLMPMFATLMPAIIFDTSAEDFEQYIAWLKLGEAFVSEINISNIGMFLKQHPIIHVFYEWDTLPTALDIKSKFGRAGIANVILHEKKDFSQGDCITFGKLDFGLVIDLIIYESEFEKTYKTKYDAQLAEFLKNICMKKLSFYLGFGNSHPDPAIWNLIEMSKLPYLVTSIGVEMGIDVSKPIDKFPEDAIALCNYDGDF